MRLSKLYAPTLKEKPSDAEVVSHQLLTRAGYIRKLTAGIYDFLPLARKVLHKIEMIIRQELDHVGAQEVSMPMVQPAEIWRESGRWGEYGPELLRLKDRKGADFCLGPTHEEVVVDIVRRDVRSWRSLPLNLYQIQVKFRDEIRPRAGLMRGREFIMKDAYSFDVHEEGASKSYEAMYQAYKKIFTRCGLDFRPVEADTGAIGGSRSHEFQVLAESGEDAIVSCDSCEYAANVEQAELNLPLNLSKTAHQTLYTEEEEAEKEKAEKEKAEEEEMPICVSTPNAKTIEEVSTLLGVSADHFVKSLLVNVDGELVIALVRGDHELNEIKLKKVLKAQSVEMATEQQVLEEFSLPLGFIGPYQLPKGVVRRVIADHHLLGMTGAVVGANQLDAHYTHISLERDCPELVDFVDLRLAQANDPCCRCGGTLRTHKGIEVGHVFYLGTKYSEVMKCNVLDEDGVERPMVMGCYGIGVSRVMAAAVEQNFDKDGICWPMSIAPYQVHILTLQPNVQEVVECAEDLYQRCLEAGVEVLYDDRNLRAGAKFKDADLIGVPLRVAVGGRGVKQGVLEVKRRTEDEVHKVKIDEVLNVVIAEVRGSESVLEGES